MSTMLTPSRAQDLVRSAYKKGGEVFTGFTWQAYRAFLDEFPEQPLHFSYDRGRLEIMPTSKKHEIYKSLLSRMLEVWAEETSTPLWFGGSMTFDREDLDRGLEPDECYWSANGPKIQGKEKLDFKIDPPPDLFIEIEVSRTILSRIDILAAFGVPEVWRFDGKKLQVGLLQAAGAYAWGRQSQTFPNLTISEIEKFLQRPYSGDHLDFVRSFRAWVRQQLSRQ